jgi:hypothetical protein
MNNKSKTPALDYLRDQVSKLNALLQEPETGLFTWHEMVNERLNNISNFFHRKNDDILENK